MQRGSRGSFLSSLGFTRPLFVLVFESSYWIIPDNVFLAQPVLLPDAAPHRARDFHRDVPRDLQDGRQARASAAHLHNRLWSRFSHYAQ